MFQRKILLLIVFYCFISLKQANIVQVFPNLNQVYEVVDPQQNTTTITYLGSFTKIEGCEIACLAMADRCWSFTYYSSNYTKNPEFTSQCYGITHQRWSPTQEQNVISGVVNWPCRNNADCSLNGECNSNQVCICNAPWSGNRCDHLEILPTLHNTGYREVQKGRNISSWGGSVLKDDNGNYHMWTSEISNHCGINAWSQNSQIIYANSTNPQGNYTKKGLVQQVFSFKPVVVKSQNGKYVMYYTSNNQDVEGWCDCCKFFSKCDGTTGPLDCLMWDEGKDMHNDLSFYYDNSTFMSYSDTPYGPWSDPVLISSQYQSDTNFAPVINEDGSLIALWRRWEEMGAKSIIFLATATNWMNPHTYVFHDHNQLFKDLGALGTEDPFVYKDKNNNFHAVFHHMYGLNLEDFDYCCVDTTGGHAFSENGINWTYTGVAWGNIKKPQKNDVIYTDGSSYEFSRSERPHLIIEDGEITHLILAVQYGKYKSSSQQYNQDASYTLIQPVKTNKNKNNKEKQSVIEKFLSFNI